MDSDDELDALLDDALDTYDQVTKEEEERTEKRQREKEEQRKEAEAAGAGAAGSPFNMLANDEAMTAFLEQTLKEMDGADANDEDKHLQGLVKQGLQLVKGEEGVSDQEMMQNCLSLLNSVTQHMGGAQDGAGDDATNPFMKELSEAVSKVATGLSDASGDGAPEMTDEERKKLETVLQELGQQTAHPPAAAAAAAAAAAGGTRHTDPATQADPDALAAIAQMMMSLTKDGAEGAAASTPEEQDMLKAARTMLAKDGEGAAGDVSDAMAEEELKKLRAELTSLMGTMPPEMADMMKNLEEFANKTEDELQASKAAKAAKDAAPEDEKVEMRVPEEE
eukprot:TRINITY_DN2822_c0_g3_i1.p1 TRINITY_DN2822_c0_g3~~TRINITY_DN2822_c0_g3_i1.p1  ORF type:complete len:336 (+),score=171.63 TRINITY_DN2822_c0_g3_i1:72-1079(+)